MENNYLFVTSSGDMLLMKGQMVANATFVGVKVDGIVKLIVPYASLAFAKEISGKEYDDLMSANKMTNASSLHGHPMASA